MGGPRFYVCMCVEDEDDEYEQGPKTEDQRPKKSLLSSVGRFKGGS